MNKDNPDDPRHPLGRTPDTPEPEVSGESSDIKSKQPTITEQIYRQFLAERPDRAYGFYQPSVRIRRDVEPLDQLLGLAGNEVEDTKSAKPHERSGDSRIASQSSKRKGK